MTISSRTPEGWPARCTLCGTRVEAEFSEGGGDAPCPRCGSLVWLSAAVLAWMQQALTPSAGEAAATHITAETALADLAGDSLTLVELVSGLESEFEPVRHAQFAGPPMTVGDLIRSIAGG